MPRASFKNSILHHLRNIVADKTIDAKYRVRAAEIIEELLKNPALTSDKNLDRVEESLRKNPEQTKTSLQKLAERFERDED